ncbi:MAG: 1-phosphofructokinase [Clostridiales bacterium]|nr:1-phosphofructokinase [Clostridiales bacterium]
MIYTLTLNPSIDHMIDVGDIKRGGTNRAVSEQMRAGGKGINVSLMLRNLGLPSVALGFVAGFTGEEICKEVRQMGIDERFIRLKEGCSRINTKIRSGGETEINGIGPEISPEDIESLLSTTDKMIDGDILVMSGSAPVSVPASIYADIMRRVSGRDIKIIADASGDLLRNTLPFHPFLIKPNRDELAALTGVTPDGDADEMLRGARLLRDAGALNVLVSMGSDGAVLLCSDGSVFKAEAPSIIPVNTVGAGDSMVAGFIFEYLRGSDMAKILKTAVTAGSASAATEGFAGMEDVID